MRKRDAHLDSKGRTPERVAFLNGMAKFKPKGSEGFGAMQPVARNRPNREFTLPDIRDELAVHQGVQSLWWKLRILPRRKKKKANE